MEQAAINPEYRHMKNCISEKRLTASVVSAAWERVTLHLTVQLSGGNGAVPLEHFQFYAIDEEFHAGAVFEKKLLSETSLELSLNVSNTGDCRALAVGGYYIYVCMEDEIIAKCVAAQEIIPEMENLSRCFLHSSRGRGYLVNFFVSDGEEELPFFMHVLHTKEEDMNPKKDKEILLSILKEPFILFRKNAGRIRWRMYYKRKRKKYRNRSHAVLFMTEQSDTLGGNLQAVKDQMELMGLQKEYEILTSARPASYIPQSHKSMKNLLTKLAKAQTIYLDDHAPILDWLWLDRQSTVIQLWHAGAGFKSSGYSRWGHLGCPGPISCHRQYSYGIAGSKQIGIFFAEVFGINDEQILPTGMPRMDEYLDQDYRAGKERELYEKYPMCKGKKVILFAPTYRGKSRKDAYYPYERIDFDRLYKFCGEEYVVWFKMHPWVKASVPIKEEHKDRFLDVGTYPNINDLFYLTEILITDYSSNIFEYSLMRKPMLFFAFDKIQYSFSRGFHRDYEEAAPGKICYEFDELMEALENKDYEFEKVGEYVDKHFDYIDSNASKRVIEWTLLGKMPEDIKKAIEKRQNEIKYIQLLDFSELEDMNEE